MQVVLSQNKAQTLIASAVVNWIERQFVVIAILALGLSVARTQTVNTSALALNPRAFQTEAAGQVTFVLGADLKLWAEQPPFGKVPPQRQPVDANVWTFQEIDPSNILVLGIDGNLWLEPQPSGKVPRQQVDGSVWSFQALDTQNVFVLGNDGALWIEPAPFNKVPNPNRQQIDGNVKAFQALDTTDVLVLGNDGNLWLEQGPWTNVPPTHRVRIDGNVWSFQAGSLNNIFVLGTDGNLWFEQPPFGSGIPHRQQVDGNVRAFQAIPALNWAWVQGTDGNLWLEQSPFGQVPPANRQQVDGNVRSFQGLDIQHALVLGTNGNLWLEQGPFGTVPPQNRQQVDANVEVYPVPGGSYTRSCKPLTNIADILLASCTNYFGVNTPSPPLLNGDTCIGTIQNINGYLRCVISQTVVTDSITQTISFTSGSDANWNYKTWTIDEPNVVQPQTNYPQITYHPGDTIGLTAGGCVQTGGLGLTWKSYVYPSGSDADKYYFGEVSLPATGLQSLLAIGGVVNKEWPVDKNLPPTIPLSDLHLTLGYTDDNYGDNGYYSHDNGNNNQCLNVGPAWVTMNVMTPRSPSQSTGPVYSPGSKPFDLVWDVNNIDGNGLPYDPLWFPQMQELKANKPLTTNDFGNLCGAAFITSTSPFGGYDVKIDEGVLQGCTSEAPTPDLVGNNAAIPPILNFGYCKDQFAPLPGHLNWGIVTYDGLLYFNNWSGGWPQDEDYNLALHRSASSGTDYSGLEASLPDEEPSAQTCGLNGSTCPSILLELKSLETLDAFPVSPWWQNLKSLAENKQIPPGTTGATAIATGLFGIDGAHKTGYTELHPVYSLAILIDSSPDPQGGIDETWEYFIRTQGNEGSCSQMVHSWESVSGTPPYPGTGPYYIQLPWPKNATAVQCNPREGCGNSYPWENGESLGPLQYLPGKWTYLQFNLQVDPVFDTGSGLGNNVGRASGFDGEIKLHYSGPPGTNLQAQVRPLATPASASTGNDIDGVDWPQVLNSIGDPAVSDHLRKFLAAAPPAISPPSIAPLTFDPTFSVFKPKPSLGSGGSLTRSRDSIDGMASALSVNVKSASGFTPPTFQGLPGGQQIYVLGTDFNLWLEQAPFGKVPPARQQVDGNVETFQAFDNQTAYVLGTDGNLWLEQAPFGKIPPARQQVDGNVLSFQALDNQTVLVLGADRKLWIEHAPFGKVPPVRQQVDANVRNFQALDAETVLVVGTDDNLWLERAPFGTVPPARRQVDGNVWSFQRSSAEGGGVFVLGADGNLWLERPPFGTVPSARRQVDANVQSFQAMGPQDPVWVQGTDGNLWLEQRPFGKVPPTRQQVDANVWAFQALDVNHVLVLGTNGNLWLEQAPFGNVPPSRQQIDGNVR